jgi:ATP-dependent Clp protease ATP-binding subunit ClpA
VAYTADELPTILWLEKIIENITPNHRLVLVALQDTMVPVEIYTHSPKCRVLPIPTPDKETRARYIRHHLGDHEHLELIADLTDGLYLRDLDHIVADIRGMAGEGSREVRRIINRYRIGEQNDYWGSLELDRLNTARRWFTETEGVKGQDRAVDRVVRTMIMARAGLAGLASGTTAKPKGVLFFAGPTGVGKTYLAKKLAKFLFNTEEAFIRFDMSEFKEEHTVSKLIGSPPGYVGYERGGMLTNAVRERPFSVVLFDEIEKAHPKIMDIYLQLLDEGRLTDSRGQTIFFTEAVIIFTSNLGCRSMDVRGRSISERDELDALRADRAVSEPERHEAIRGHFQRSVEQFFTTEISRPELLNRFGNNIIPFNFIQSDEVQGEIVRSHLRRISEEFADKFRQPQFRFRLFVDEGVVAYLIATYGKQMEENGGRGITNALENEVLARVAPEVLAAEMEGRQGLRFDVRLVGGRIEVEAVLA